MGKNKAKVRQEVSVWRDGREKERRFQEEATQRQAQVKLEREGQERRRQVEQNREAVAAFRQQRLAEEQRLRDVTNATNQASHLSADDRQRIAERSETLQQRKAALLHAKQASAAKAVEPASQSSTYLHVDSKVGEHTDAYVERLRIVRAQAEAAPAGVKGSRDQHAGGNFAHQALVRPVRSSL